MEVIEFELSDDQFDDLRNHLTNGKSSSVGKKAVEVAKMYFELQYPSCQIVDDTGSSFLTITSNENTFRVMVKGTEKDGISWSTLKVSSTFSYNEIISGVPVYRVTNVNGQKTIIYVLKHGDDFGLEPEPRWSFVAGA